MLYTPDGTSGNVRSTFETIAANAANISWSLIKNDPADRLRDEVHMIPFPSYRDPNEIF
jgi:hypothetical protein